MKKNAFTTAPNSKSTVKKANAQARSFAPDHAGVMKYFQILNENDEPIFQALDMFPIPIEIFAHDGTTVFYNYAFMELNSFNEKTCWLVSTIYCKILYVWIKWVTGKK